MTGADLATWRTAHALSVAEAARLLGTTRESIYAWEDGRIQMRGTVQQLLTYLHDPIMYRRAHQLKTR